MPDPSNHFKKFIRSMDVLINDSDHAGAPTQRKMMEDLFVLERKFRDLLVASKTGRDLYRRFMDYIMDDEGNILKTRIYFRERQGTFSRRIAPAFHHRKPEALYKFRINYPFCRWIMEAYPLTKRVPSAELRRLYGEIGVLRRTLCENNLPSAIHQAKCFWSRVLDSHIEYMDMIQSATEGLINAIDKFTPPFKKVFGSVICSRMKGRIMEEHNSTLVKIPTRDRRILYRAKNAKNKQNLSEDKEILKYVKESFAGASSQTMNDVFQAETAASLDDKPEGGRSLSETVTDYNNPEIVNEARDSSQTLQTAVLDLTVPERKTVTMKFGYDPAETS